LPSEYRRIEVPVERLGSAEARARGSVLFLEHCALCHGERGDGRGARREGLTRAPRDFTNPAWRASTSPRRVFHAIREGSPLTPMPGWKALTEQDAWDMTAYVLSLGAPR
jgi:mono/diheme cytochrome c family protein